MSLLDKLIRAAGGITAEVETEAFYPTSGSRVTARRQVRLRRPPAGYTPHTPDAFGEAWAWGEIFPLTGCGRTRAPMNHALYTVTVLSSSDPKRLPAGWSWTF